MNRPPRRVRRWRHVAVALCAGAVVSCASSGSPSTGAPDSEVVVFAAASLREAFTEIGRRFTEEHPSVTVRVNFAGSSDLVAQIQQGAPADVLATADETTMAKAVAAGHVNGMPQAFATNTLTIAVPQGNPEGIRGFADLARDGLQVVVCAPQVPCGAATARVEQKTGVDLSPVSEELSVADVLGKVANGQADAGVVYTTDLKASRGRVSGVAIPAADNVVNTYPIAVLNGSAAPDPARQFRAWVLSRNGRAVLVAAGFGSPGGSPQRAA